MSANENDTGETQSRQGGFSVAGAELANARESKQLSLESVAAELHLQPEIVRAIEAGDEARLPAAAYARGYIKSYARLLGLDEASIIAKLPDLTPQRAAPLKRVGMRRRRISLPIGRWLVRGLLLFAVVMLLVYGAPVIERLWTDKAPEPVADQLPLPPSGLEQSLDAIEIPGPGQLPAPVQDEADPVAREAVSKPPPAEAAPVQAPVAETQADTQEAVGPAVVHLRFVEDSWVEMEAHGRKLVVGTQRAGSERTVRVEPPVSLLLGNSPGVELSYRGRPVDLSAYQRGKVARLTLED